MMTSYEKYSSQSISVFPCHRDKTPATENGFYDATTDIETLKKLFYDNRFIPGMPTGEINGIVVIDFDNKEHISIEQCIEQVEDRFGPLPETLTIETQSGGLHYYYIIDGPTKTKTRVRFLDKSLPIDIRSNGGYVCCPGDNTLYTPIDDMDDVFWTNLKSLCAPLPSWIENFEKEIEQKREAQVETLPHSEIIEVRSALVFIESDDYDIWIKIGQCLKSTGSPSGFYLWEEWSQKSNKYDPKVMQSKWESFKNVKDLTIATIFHEAKKNGWVTTYLKSVPVADIDLDEIDEKRNHDKNPFPEHLLNPPGLVGEIVSYINKFSKKNQPILALAAALSASGAIMGQRFQTDQGLRTNLYVLGVGESGCGKEAARTSIKRLFENAGIGQLASVEDLASDAAVITELEKNPSQVFLIDEIGRFLKVTNKAVVTQSHLYNIISVLLKIYSSSHQMFYGKSYADSKKGKKIDSPNLCIYGTTVPRSLFEGLSVENITDGFLSRFLIFESEDPDPKPTGRRKFAMQHIDVDLVKKVKEIFAITRNVVDKGNIEKLDFVKPAIVEMSDDAEDMATGYENFIYEKREKIRKTDSIFDAIYNRAPQFAEQIALIIAVGRNYNNPLIELNDFQYAIELTNYLTDRMHFIAKHYISNNEYEILIKKVLNAIRETGKRGMTKTQFSKKFQRMNKFQKEDALHNLESSGQIKVAIRDNGTTVYYPIKENE